MTPVEILAGLAVACIGLTMWAIGPMIVRAHP